MITAAPALRAWVRGVPLRVKLVAAVLALVTAALVVISAMSTLLLHSYLVDQVDRDLRAASRVVGEALPQPGTQVGLPTNFFVTLVTDRGVSYTFYPARFVAREELPAIPTDPTDLVTHLNEPFTVKAADRPTRWRVLITRDVDTGQLLVVGQNFSSVDRALSHLIWIDVLVGGAVLVVLAALGAAIVRASLRPLREIEQTAAAIAAGDLTRRIPDPEAGEPEPKSELGRLSRALNVMLTQIETAFTARAASESAARFAEAAARAAEAAARDAAMAAQASEARARRSEERMRQFVADASHELRTPLTTIRGFAELYRQGAADAPEDAARLMRRIEDEAARMGLLVEDLLLLARLDRERPLTLAPVELPVLATEAVQAARAVAPERDIALRIEPGAGNLVVLGDDARLRQVIGNLMTNALTHTPPDASVTLRLRREAEDGAVVEVADTGPGLTPAQAERVFERFYRVDAARTRRADGVTSTGLGLAIVAALVAAHEGSVEVAQTPGGGATFRVRLPIASETDEDRGL